MPQMLQPRPQRVRGAIPSPQSKIETAQWRKWEGVNVRDSRMAIGDTELAWLENVIPIGNGRLELLPRHGDPVFTVTGTQIATIWGMALGDTWTIMAVCVDGSVRAFNPTTGSEAIALPGGTVTVNAHLTIWQTTDVLIIDPVKGYFSWDGVAPTVIDLTTIGQAIAVFEGRVWIAAGRTLIYTAPNTFDDFDPSNGAGSTVITDEAFPGNIKQLVSALEQLWIVGDTAIDALSNVAAVGDPPDVVTSFTITNIVSNLGSPLPASVTGYFRALAFIGAASIYALSGVTPQKISDKLDEFPTDGDLGGPVHDFPAAICVVRNLITLMYLVHYIGRDSLAGPAPTPLLLCFIQGRWFFAWQGAYLRWITTVSTEAWGTDGTNIYQIFGGGCHPVKYKIVSKLYDFGDAARMKTMTKLGIEVRGPSAQHELV